MTYKQTVGIIDPATGGWWRSKTPSCIVVDRSADRNVPRQWSRDTDLEKLYLMTVSAPQRYSEKYQKIPEDIDCKILYFIDPAEQIYQSKPILLGSFTKGKYAFDIPLTNPQEAIQNPRDTTKLCGFKHCFWLVPMREKSLYGDWRISINQTTFHWIPLWMDVLVSYALGEIVDPNVGAPLAIFPPFSLYKTTYLDPPYTVNV